ncbi:MAG: lysoplasmalogenase family protein [Flavobacterium sp.]
MKSIVVPSIFFYFYSSNNFRINKTQILIFVLCFTGEVFHLMNVDISDLGSMICFLLVHLTLLKMIIIDEKKKIKLKRNDILPIALVVLLVVYLLFSVLSLQFDRMRDFHFIYGLYGIVLSALGIICYAKYIARGTYRRLLLTLMVTCFIFSDIFFIFNEYFSYSLVLILIRDITQIMSYFFMAKYFILSSKRKRSSRL